MTEENNAGAPAGWFDDGSGRQRYWDGQQWTDQFAAPPVAAKSNRALWWLLGIVGGVILLCGGGLLAALIVGFADESDSGSTSGASVVRSEEPAEEEAAPQLGPKDWKVKVPIRSKECFGSAGCNIEFGVVPEYVGVEDASDGHYLVTFEVRGVEDGPMIQTFEVTDGTIEWEDSLSAGLTDSSATIKAVVTSVETLDY
jgi:hypothetical protein